MFAAVAQNLGIRLVFPEALTVSGSGVTEEQDPKIREIWQTNFPGSKPEEILRGYTLYNDAVRSVASQFGATVIRTSGFGLRGAEWFAPYDHIHFNDRGAERMGQQMAEATVAAGVLDSRTDAMPGAATPQTASSRRISVAVPVSPGRPVEPG